VDETLQSLDLRGRVAQLVMVWMSGGYASRSDSAEVRIEKLVSESGIGGIVISLGTPYAYAARLNRLQSLAAVPLLVAADFEAGPGFRVGGIYALPSGMDMGGATVLPPQMAFGAAGDRDLVYEAGRITALEARALGVHLNFAPVLDVNNNPDNPIINTRSFGEDPDRVAELGAAYIRGAREGGLMTTAKHFPGHGDTGTDSHLHLAVVPGDRARLDAIELVPFRRAIAAGVDAVMTAHVSVPGILGPDAPPATLSSYFMTRLLREEMGFEGVLFTDALDMGAIVDGYGTSEASVRALEAGADVLLMPPDPVEAIEAVVAAVQSGRIPAERITESARRVLEMKARAGLDRSTAVDLHRLPDLVATAEHEAFADSVARRSITLARDLPGNVPIDTLAVRHVLSITVSRERDVAAGRAFDERLAETFEVSGVRVVGDTSSSAFDAIVARADSADVVILSEYAAPSVTEEPDAGVAMLNRLLATLELHRKPAVLVSFGTPYLLTVVPDPLTYLLAWGGAGVMQRAAADALLGRERLTGRLPISLPPLYALGEGLGRDAREVREIPRRVAEAREVSPGSVGMDAAALDRVDRLLEGAIRDSVTPGAALAVGRAGRLVRLRGYGRLDWDAASSPVTDSSLYDLASLTKVVGTTTAIMGLVDAGRLSLADRIGDYLPEWADGWKAEVRVEDLLLHRGGLPPFRPFWRDLEGRSAYRDAIAALPREYEVGARTVYSDIGLITLQFVIETVTGRPLDEVLAASVFGPLEMDETGFNPPSALLSRIAPTEVDTVFRHRHLRGEVHDENAFALGGVAGHAGLFSSARDLSRFAGWILAAAREGRGIEVAPEGALPAQLPAPATVAAFTRRATEGSSRALGWDTPSDRSSAGRFFTATAFGHTGFTGTSIWVDPARDVFVVLLTNRVDPTRAERGHIPLRRAVHDAVAASIRDIAVTPREPTGGGGR